mmetsp:Transcript_27822/g.69453  ORF Transcript_27822/g.69453 Transcript_27822/m.69453 type:complete len:209 (+) Transcript_27822:1643-2269(+)
MSGEMVHPALTPQLPHGGVNPWVARLALLPGLDPLLIVDPCDLSAYLVARHPVIVVRRVTNRVEEFAPVKLPQERHGRLRVALVPLVDGQQMVIELASRHTAELHIGRHLCGAGRVEVRRLGLGLLERCDPLLIPGDVMQPLQPDSLAAPQHAVVGGLLAAHLLQSGHTVALVHLAQHGGRGSRDGCRGVLIRLWRTDRLYHLHKRTI